MARMPRGCRRAVAIDDFYVVLPSPPVVTIGQFEQSDGLRIALCYHDRVNQ